MRGMILLCAIFLSIAETALASGASLPSWAKGDWQCRVDNRLIQISWRIEERNACPPGADCSASYAVAVGTLVDGGPPATLTVVDYTADTLRFRHPDRNIWTLRRQPDGTLKGQSVWNRTAYPLHCGHTLPPAQPLVVARKPDRVDAMVSPSVGVAKANPGKAKITDLTPVVALTCKAGFVWREARADDTICVSPESRTRVRAENANASARVDPNGPYGPNTCLSGFVWREAFEGDVVCVTPDIRTLVKQENALASSRRVGGP